MSFRYLCFKLSYYFVFFYTFIFPHRYAKRGLTKVKYNFSHRADELFYLQDEHNCWQHGTGTVVDFGYVYEAPGPGRRKKIGVYSCGNDLFSDSFIVRDDTTGKLLTMDRSSVRFTAKYGIGIPLFYRRKRDERFIRDFTVPLKAYPGDAVVLEKLLPDHHFVLDYVVFTSLGSPRYKMKYSQDELVQIRDEINSINGEGQEDHRNMHNGYLCDGDFEVVSRGNMYHLHNNGRYTDFDFESLDAEVDFWSHQSGEWLDDLMKVKEYNLHQAVSAIEREEINMAVEMSPCYCPIKILPHFIAFRQYARKASLAQLKLPIE